MGGVEGLLQIETKQSFGPMLKSSNGYLYVIYFLSSQP